jgi:hypothetical protein
VCACRLTKIRRRATGSHSTPPLSRLPAAASAAAAAAPASAAAVRAAQIAEEAALEAANVPASAPAPATPTATPGNAVGRDEPESGGIGCTLHVRGVGE